MHTARIEVPAIPAVPHTSQERHRGYGSLAGESLAGEISPEEYEVVEHWGTTFLGRRGLHRV